MLVVFGFITCILRRFTLRKVAVLEQEETMSGYYRLEHRQYENFRSAYAFLPNRLQEVLIAV
jgi:hypothetical protein